MHAAFNTNEILHRIFCYIHAKRNVYHAALVCKQFLPHALDALWYSIDTLRHLLALIPDASTATSLLAFTGTRLPTKADMLRFDLHAHRVHELTLVPTHPIRVPIMMQLLDCLGRQSLLPNLHILRLGAVAKDLNEADCFFLCPTLTRLEIRYSDISYFLSRVVQVAPFLYHLDISHQAVPVHLIPLIKHLRQLKTLRTKNKFIISADSPFPFPDNLEELRASSVIVRLGGLSLPPSTQFQALTTLQLVDQLPADDIVGLLSQPIFPKLQDISIVAPSYSKGNAGVARFQDSWLSLCKVLFSNSREIIEIKGNHQYENIIEDIGMDLACFFEGVARQPSLSAFWMGEPKLLKPLNSVSLGRLCTTFPSLTDLYIQLQESTLISFDNLVVLADQLPLLRQLEIGINGANLACPPSVPILSHKLVQLCIKTSSIGDPFLFAHYVDRLFPFADVQNIEHPSNDERSVISAHKLIRACRKDQETRDEHKPSRKRQTARRGRR